MSKLITLVIMLMVFCTTASASHKNMEQLLSEMVEARYDFFDDKKSGTKKILSWEKLLTSHHDSIKSEAHYLFAHLYSHTQRCAKSIPHSRKAIEYAIASGRHETRAMALTVLSICGDETQHPTINATELEAEAIQVALLSGNKNTIAVTYLMSAITSINTGETFDGMVLLSKAEKLWEHIERKADRSAILATMGAFHVYEGDDERAIDYYLKSLKIVEDDYSIDGVYARGYTYHDLSSVYARHGDEDLSYEYAEKTIEVAQGMDEPSLVAQGYTLLAEASERRGNFEEAMGHIDTAISIGGGFMTSIYFGDLYVTSAVISGKLGNTIRMNSDFKTANRLYAKTHDNYGFRNMYWSAYSAYKDLELNAEAFEYLEQFVGVDRIMRSKRDEEAIAELKANLEVGAKQLEIANLEAANRALELKDEKQSKRIWIIFGGMSLLIVIVIFLVFRILYHRKAQQKFKQLALTDDLTQIPNRRFFFENLERRAEAKEETCIILFDIDFFKQINDSFGHDVGDVVLKDVAHVAKNTVRDGDIVARFGGEEFVVLLANTNIENAIKMAERIRVNIHDHDFGIDQKVTASFGVAYVDENVTIEESIKAADVFMYEAKESGRNRVASAA